MASYLKSLVALVRNSFALAAFVVFGLHGIIMPSPSPFAVYASTFLSFGDKEKSAEPARGEYRQQSAGGPKIPTTVDQPPHSNENLDEETDSKPKTKPFMSNAEWIMAGLTACYFITKRILVPYSRRTLEKIEEQVELD